MKKILSLLIIMFTMFLIFPSNADASEFNFAVNPIIPENQIDKSISYFDLMMEKEQKQTLQIELRNDTDKDVKIDVSLANATTNINGVVEYSPNDIKVDESLKYAIQDIVKAPKDIMVPAKGNTVLDLNVQMPKEAVNGVIAAGITLKQHEEQTTENTDEQSGVSIKNEYSYVVGLVLRESKTIVDPNLMLDKVEPTQVNYRNVIMNEMRNDQPAYINQVAIDGAITKKGDDKVLYKVAQDGMQVAPNSTFSYPVSLNGNKLEPGEYHVKLVVYGNKSDAGEFERKTGDETNHFEKRWILEKDFTITAEKAKDLNEKDVSLKQETNWWLYILLAAILILLILVVILLIVLKRKKKEDDSDK